MALAMVFIGLALFNGLFGSSPLDSGPAPSFQLEDLEGNLVDSEQLENELVILNFWFTSCGACRQEIPHLAEFNQKFPDTRLYGVNVDSFDAKRLKRLSAQLQVTYPVLRDVGGQLAQEFGVSLFPTTFIVMNGEIVSTSQGVLSIDGLEAEVARVRRGG